MRRGTRGRGGGYNNRPPPRPQNQNRPSSGPLMTNHLQGLEDIDMELELLKRKREIIEQQQQMLNTNYRQRNDYEQPMFDQPRDNRYDDYARLYDNPREPDHYGSGGRKRAIDDIPVWENESPPKRFSAPSRGVKKTFGTRPGPPQNSRQDYEPRPAAHKPFKRPAQSGPHKKNDYSFNPTRVTKHSAGPPAKVASYRPAERKKLVTEAMSNPALAVRRNPASASAAWVLREDREPSRQVVGRLELALGGIMKEIKFANPGYEELFQLPSAMRAMKQAVRERVRTAMMGKQVTTVDLIKAAYYDMFPSADGNEIVLKGLEVQTGSEFLTIASDDPEIYFKKNMHRLMALRMEEMIKKLEEIYNGKNTDSTPKETTITSNDAKAENGSQTNDVEALSNADETAEPAASNTDDVDIETNKSQVPNVAASPHEAPEDTTGLEKLVSLDQYKAFDRLMSLKMVHMIKKFGKDFLKVMDLDAKYRKMKENITNETKKKLSGNTEIAPKPKESSPTQKTTEKRFSTPLQYYVKIMGKPSLPKRKAMETFFAEFKPKNVKKHRSIYNLLFVGFADKESFEKILAADGTVIGKSTLDIKVSERSDKKNQNQNKSVDSNQSVQSLDESGSEVLGADLDEQITDLLTSIRKSEQFDFSSDDITMYELPAEGNQNDVKKDGDVTMKSEPDVTSDAAQGDEKIDLTKNDDDVVEIKDVPKNIDIVEIKDDPSDKENEISRDIEIKDDQSENDNQAQDSNIIEIKDDQPEKNNQANDDDQAIKDDQAKEDDVAKKDDQAKEDDVAKKDDQAKEDDQAQEDNQAEKDVQLKENEAKTTDIEEAEKKDTVQPLRTGATVKPTPTRSSARLATPGGIKTRRMSKLE